MKKSIAYFAVIASAFISSNASAAWTIPGSQCKEIGTNLASYDSGDNSFANHKIRDPANPKTFVKIRCLSPIYSDYGNKLDMDFVVLTASSIVALSCTGFSLDANGKVVEETKSISANGHMSSPKMISASQYKKYVNVGTPVAVGAECVIPDAVPYSCDPRICTDPKPAKLVNIRVY